MVKNFGIFFNDFWRLLTGFVKDSRSETPFRFIKFTCFGIFKLSFLSIFSFTCSIFIISTGILAFSTNEYIEYDLPFSFFVFIFSISYFFSKFIWIQVSKLGRRNILFHIFYVLFVLNVVNLIMYYNLFHISASTYFSVSFAYLVASVFWVYLKSKMSKLIFILISIYSLIAVFLNFDFSLIFSNSIVYRKTRWDPFFVYFPKRLIKFIRYPPIRRSVRIFYKHFSDSSLIWDYSICFYILFYLALSIIFFFVSVILYYRFLVKFHPRNLGSYFLYPFLSVCFLSFFIYFSWSFSHYFNEDFFINAFFELYKLLSFFNIYAYYMTYLMFMIYAFILVTLFTSWFVLFRRLIHRLANRPYVLDLDYKTIKKIVYGKKEVPLFWKFPRSWVKSFYIRLKKPRKSRTLELPEDAEFYYGGPNPSRVLFNHYTGEVFPIFIKDLILENYRIYYKLRRFAIQQPLISGFSNSENEWLREFFKEDIRPFSRWFSRSLSGPFYFYPRSNVEFDYTLNQRLTFEDIDDAFEQSELMQESLTKNMYKDEDEQTGTWSGMFDRHAWESLWFQDFAKRLPVVGERSFYNFSNPAFEVFSLDESARLGSNERDGHFNVLINREQRLSKQSLAFEQTLGFFPNPKYFELGSFSFIGSSLSGFNLLLFIGFQNLFFNEFYPEFEFFEFKPQIYRLVTFMWDWFERRIGADDLELLEVDVTLRAWRFEMRPKLKTLYKINAQNLFFTSIVRLISFSFTKVLEIDQEINSVFFKFQCARYFSSMFMNSSISNRYGASFGFLVQLIRFGFVGEDLRPYYKPKEDAFRFFGGWDCFSLNSSYHSNVQFFSVFPFFSYLPNWKIEFSGFFEHPKFERYIDIKQGRYGRFRFVNPRIILENETSEKIYNYFINLKVWLQDSTGLVPNVRDYFLLDTVSKYLKLFVLGKYIYLRYTTNYSLIRHAFQFYKINKIEICNPSASKQVLVDRDENRGPIDTEFVYIPFKERLYGQFPSNSIDYNSFFGSGAGLYSGVRMTGNASLYGLDVPIAYTYSTTSSFYTNSHFISLVYAQNLSNTGIQNYGKNFMFRGFQNNQMRVPIFFSIFDQKFSNAFFKFQSLDIYLFNNFRAEFLINTGVTIFFKYKKNVNIGFLDFYKFVKAYPSYFFNFLSLNNTSVVGLCFKYLYSYWIKVIRPYNFTLFFKFPKFSISPKKFNTSTRRYIRGYRWVHNWSIKFIWAPGNKNRYEYYSFKRNSYSNYSFFSRMEVDLAMKSSLSGVIVPSFLFGFLFVYDLDRVFK